MPKFTEWYNIHESLNHLKRLSQECVLSEADYSHYSIEVNYRTTKQEMLQGFSKLVLGFVSAAVKKNGYHVKHCFSVKPFRLMIATRNFDDGEWVGCLVYNNEKHKFVISAGYWNKDRRSVSIDDHHTKEIDEDNAADLVDKVINFMHNLKKNDSRIINKLKPAQMKRGPKG